MYPTRGTGTAKDHLTAESERILIGKSSSLLLASACHQTRRAPTEHNPLNHRKARAISVGKVNESGNPLIFHQKELKRPRGTEQREWGHRGTKDTLLELSEQSRLPTRRGFEPRLSESYL